MNKQSRTAWRDAEPNQALWLTWEKQVRNRNLSRRLNACLVEIIERGGRLSRYIKSAFRSAKLLWQWRRKTVFVQNPSIVLSLLAVLLKPFLHYRLVVDAHNAGIYPGEPEWLLLPITRFIIRFADFIIVTNDALATRVTKLGGHALVLPDPLPTDFDGSHQINKTKLTSNALFICSWAADEPYFEVVAAAETLPHVQFFITGASKGREKGFGRPLPSNVELTGYVPDEKYHGLILSADVVIDLTTREDCLVCGAYEAVAACKPFVLSDTKALRTYFREGGLHVANESKAIAAAILAILSEREKFKHSVSNFKKTLETEWTQNLTTVLASLEKIK